MTADGHRHHQRAGDDALAADRWDDAIAAYGAAVLLRPDLAAGHVGLGEALRRAGRTGAARRVLEKAVQIAPSHRGAADALLGLPDDRPHRLDYRVGDTLHGVDGAYRVRQVMRGGHGAVFVVDLLPGSAGHLPERTYALKTFRTGYLRRAEDRDRFANEAITWVSLDPHPNVVTALWVERIEGLPGLLLEYVPSGDLARLIDSSRLPLERALTFGMQLCDGLDHASRSLRIAHGDVKPANCLVTEDGVLKVTDFGLAQAFGPARDEGGELAVLPDQLRAFYRGALGAPAYRAPEQLRPGARIDVRTDIYALGVLLYEMINDDRPRDGGIALAHIRANPPDRDLPTGLLHLITDCVDPDPRKRPRGLRDVRESLELAYQMATRTPAPGARSAPPPESAGTVRRGASLTRLGRAAEAVDLLHQVVEREPDHAQALLHLAIALAADGRTEESLRIFDGLLGTDPDAVPVLIGRAAALARLDRRDSALASLDRAILLDPTAREAHRTKGELLAALDRPDAALRCLGRALDIDPRDEQALALQGRILAQLGRHAEALHALNEALRIDPTAVAAECERGRALVGLGNFAEGLEWLDRGPGPDLDRFGRRIARSRALRGLGRTDEALAELDRVLDLDPGDEVAWGEKYELLCAMDREAEATALAEQRRRDREPSPGAIGPRTGRSADVVHGDGDGDGSTVALPTGAGGSQHPKNPQYSSAVLLAWQLAAWERNLGSAEMIEPYHLLLGIGKLCDLDLAELDLSAFGYRERESIEREHARARAVFDDSGVELTRFRRALRTQVARRIGQSIGRTAHRSPDAKQAFRRARRLAAADGIPTARLADLLRAVLESIVGSPGYDPKDALAALSTALRGPEPVDTAAPAPELAGAAPRTPRLDAFGRDLTALAAADRLGPIIGREADVHGLASVLARAQKSNALLVGEPGVGKTAIVEALAIALAGDDPPGGLRDRRLVELSVSTLVGGTKYRGEFEERLSDVIAEASNDPNIVLFIDELHVILGAGGPRGGLDAANILKPALARGEIQLIGATTEADHRRYIESDDALTRRFQLVRVAEPSAAVTAAILRGLRSRFEDHHGLRIADDAVEAAVALSRRHQPDLRFPDKAIDLLDQSCADARLRGIRRTDGEDVGIGWDEVADAVATRLGVPRERLGVGRSERLADLADVLGAHVVGQRDAVAAVCEAVRIARGGLRGETRPGCSLLFVGPAGTGKTALATALAEALSGSAPLTVDLGEYTEPHSVSRLLGAPPGYVGHDDDGPLIGPIRTDPFRVVLLESIDRAHPQVVDALLPILDVGSLTGSHGRRASFADAVVILTVGTGGTGDRGGIGFGSTPAAAPRPADDDALRRSLARSGSVPTGVLDRITQVVRFAPLDRTALREITDRSLAELSTRLGEQRLELEVTAAVRDALVDVGTDDARGARAALAAVDRLVAGPLARSLVSGEVDGAAVLVVDLVDGTSVVRPGPEESGRET